MIHSVAMTEALDAQLRGHLARRDGQEDLCFATWHPSRGNNRTTALVSDWLAPLELDRHVHGNASFDGAYLERAIDEAIRRGGGVAFLHSHPARGWQGMSDDDVIAEQGMAGAVLGATGRPLVGLTLAAKDGTWSARHWERTAPRNHVARHCETVRVCGAQLTTSFNPSIRPASQRRPRLRRTIDAWGEDAQAHLARMHVGVVGLGSVGSIVAEAVARTGVERVSLIDFDSIEEVNLDRTLNSYTESIGVAKVSVAAQAARRAATAENPRIRAIDWSICEEDGFRLALDCDVLFSCVDRPWPRAILNFMAYAHLIPVIDGGILARRTLSGRLRGANWKAHTVGPGRPCLACLGQYEPGEVDTDRQGLFDDPKYIQGLPADSVHRANQNVFGFSLSLASLEFLQLLTLTVRAGARRAAPAQNYHFPEGVLDINDDLRECKSGCVHPTLVALGEDAGPSGTARHLSAEKARDARRVSE